MERSIRAFPGVSAVEMGVLSAAPLACRSFSRLPCKRELADFYR
jgi:hypothetical protein